MKFTIVSGLHAVLYCWLLTGSTTQAQGTIQFYNSGLTRVTIVGVGPVPTEVDILYGVFWGRSLQTMSTTPVSPLAPSSKTYPGLIDILSTYPNYPIPGAIGGEEVYLQIRGWDAAYGADWSRARDEGAVFGETIILPFVLGPQEGPGTVIWSNIYENRFRPLILVPEPSPVTIGALALFGFAGLQRVRKGSQRAEANRRLPS